MLQLVIGVIVALVIIGVLMALLNRYGAPYLHPPILQLLNIAVIIIVILCLLFYLLQAFGLVGLTGGPPVPKLR